VSHREDEWTVFESFKERLLADVLRRTAFEKINVLPNFLIHIMPGNWLHCAVLNEQRYYWSFANNYDVG
jgi:hypothetical protein